MLRLAFYAPLKSPQHAVPSGDREVARGLIKAFETLGAKVTLASTLRSREGKGDPAQQVTLMAEAAQHIPSLIQQGREESWQAWVTYHNYYKAPDLLGPAVAKALHIPYLQIESTRARKRLSGPWAGFAQAAEDAADAADVIFYVTTRDAQALIRDAPKGQQLSPLPPFLPRDDLPAQTAGTGPMLAVGMMRPGDKCASYALIAQTLHLLPQGTWRLNIAGDGSARTEVEHLMAPFADTVHFLGALPPEQMSAAYQNAAVLLWPGVNEAFGLAYLEAQSHGVPVVAQDRPGVRDVLAPNAYPAPEDGAQGLARMLIPLLQDPHHRRTQGHAAAHFVAATHLLPAAAQTLRQGLINVGVFP